MCSLTVTKAASCGRHTHARTFPTYQKYVCIICLHIEKQHYHICMSKEKYDFFA